LFLLFNNHLKLGKLTAPVVMKTFILTLSWKLACINLNSTIYNQLNRNVYQ